MPIYKHDNFIPLETNASIWRYLDLDKFVSLLETKSLFFCRSDKFSDPFEGSLPKREAEHQSIEEKAYAEANGFHIDSAFHNILSMQNFRQKLKSATIINCWHINKNESDAMWRLYLKDNEGVAIQSTTQRIEKTIQKTADDICLSKVRYLDYDNDVWYHPIHYPHLAVNLFIPHLHKRIEFIHENEFRLFLQIDDVINNSDYWESQSINKGKLIPIDLEILIEKIYLPPTIDEKTAIKIEELSKSFGYNFQFERSSLSHKPYY